MRPWALLLAGLTVWAAHFFVLYGIASVLPGRPASAAWLVLAATVVAVAADALILRRALSGRASPDALDNWIARGAGLGAALSLLAVIWQAVPILFV